MAETTEIVINIDEEVVNECYRSFVFDKPKFRRYFIYGGAGSGKSYAVAQHLLLQCLRSDYFRCIYMRKVARTIRNSVYLLFKDLISSYNLNDLFNCMDTTMDIHCINGNSLLAAGMDDAEKIKSIQEPNCFWLEEATEFDKKDFGQMLLRCRTQKAFNYSICTFNPVSKKSWTYEMLKNSDTTETCIIFSTHKNNSFLSDTYLTDIEMMKNISDDYYRIYALGEWGSGDERLVFDRYQIYDEEKEFDCFGIDFGFTNPTAIVGVSVDLERKKIYVKELLYQTKADINIIEDALKKNNGYKKMIFADSEDAFKINELYSRGFNIYGAKKDVYAGLLTLKQFNLYVHSSSKNLMNELDTYSHASDKHGNVIEGAVIKKDDHAVDALRYAVYNYVIMNQYKTIIV